MTSEVLSHFIQLAQRNDHLYRFYYYSPKWRIAIPTSIASTPYPHWLGDTDAGYITSEIYDREHLINIRNQIHPSTHTVTKMMAETDRVS